MAKVQQDPKALLDLNTWRQIVGSKFPLMSAGQLRRIAIIGTEGCGKTIFITALAKHLESRQADGWFLDPQNAQTQRYVDRIWAILNRGEWPAQTGPGTLQQLLWKLHLPNLGTAEIRIVDPPGHDIRRLFSDNRAEPGSVPADLQELADYCRNADIVLFLVNLKDFLGEPNQEMRSASELALKFGMEYVRQAGSLSKHCCLVFTQVDLYPGLAADEGGWENVARKYLPMVFGSQLRQGEIPVLAVSAVDATRVAVTDNGQAFKFPANEFRSKGLEGVVSWIERRQRELQIQMQWVEIHKRMDISVAVFLQVICLLFVLWLGSGVVAWLTKPAEKPKPAVQWHWEDVHYDQSWWDKLWGNEPESDVIVWGEVENQGAAGHVTVFASVKQGKNEWTSPVIKYLDAGEKQPFELRITEWHAGTHDTPKVWAK